MDKPRKSRFVIELEDVIFITDENQKQLGELRSQLRESGFAVPDHVQLGVAYARPTDGATATVRYDRKSGRYEATFQH